MNADIGRVLPYAVPFKISPAGRPHAHGVACLDQATIAELDSLKRALATAGSKTKAYAGSRKVNVDGLYDADSWTAYFCRPHSGTVKTLGTVRSRPYRARFPLAEQEWTGRLAPAPVNLAA